MGKDYFEGDMILTPKQQAYLDNIKTNGAPTQEGTKRGLIKDTMYLWPKAKVYFDFDKGVGKFTKVIPTRRCDYLKKTRSMREKNA